MTERYDLLLKAIQDTNLFIVRMFLYALTAVIAYPVLEWTPVFIRRPMRWFYLGSLLAVFVFVTVFFGGAW